MPHVPCLEGAAYRWTVGSVRDDGSRLEFDPWSPHAHRCARCGIPFSGERHDRAWAHYQHLWLAERAAHLATVAVSAPGDDGAAGERAERDSRRPTRRYLDYPNRDNVLGPSRLFFSTYLESIWIGGLPRRSRLLREAGLLPDATAEVVGVVADEAANLIGEFDEGFSNRQTWHNAALASIAVWFEDEELAGRAIEGATGDRRPSPPRVRRGRDVVRGRELPSLRAAGPVARDGVGRARPAWTSWPMLGSPTGWRRRCGLRRSPRFRTHTFPARKDSRFGVSLAQPMYLELWEIGLARLGDQDSALWGWLASSIGARRHRRRPSIPTCTRRASRPVGLEGPVGALLVVAARDGSVAPRGRRQAVAARGDPARQPGTGRSSGTDSGTPASSAAVYGGGHGHPDRLNLMLHADGVYWLPDPGTGSYVARDLFWYRSTLAHNAPRLDGVSQPPGDARCLAFDVEGDWAWTRGAFGGFTRTVVTGTEYLLDVVEFGEEEPHLVELAWHPAGEAKVDTPGEWSAAPLTDEFVLRCVAILPFCRGIARAPRS